MKQAEWLEGLALEHGHRVALTGQASLTYSELYARAADVGMRMRASGVRGGDRVAILSESRPYWALTLFAIWDAGAVAVPLDDRLEEAELLAQARDAMPVAVIASARSRASAVNLAAGIPQCRVACFDDPSDEWYSGPATVAAPPVTRTGDTSAEAAALIVYTSGTAGTPKGVVLTHGNLKFQIETFPDLFDIGPGTIAVSILPLSHVFELTVGLMGVLHGGGSVFYCASLLPDEIQANLREARPTTMIVVPLFLKMMKASIERGVAAAPLRQRLAFKLALRFSPWLQSQRFRRSAFHRIHDIFGGRLEFFICGGAPLTNDTAAFFASVGIAVYQGYGLTENAPVVSTNSPRWSRRGSVGRPLPGLEVRCGVSRGGKSAGEISVRGPSVMLGYFRRPELTAERIDADGWLRTGDLGYFDCDGYLHVTGRGDDLIVLGNGKNVSPEEVEQCLNEDIAIKEVMVMGHLASKGVHAGTREVCAVVVPADAFRDRYTNNPVDLQREMHEAVRRSAKRLAIFKRPTRIIVRTDELPKTVTRKVRRKKVVAWVTEMERRDASTGD